jgi:hypothetical protein
MAVEAAKVSGNPEVFYHQRPNDNSGASFSPYVGVPMSSQHYAGVRQSGGRKTKRSRRHRK